jgi:hypothetical protein
MELPTNFKTKNQRIKFAKEFLGLTYLSDEVFLERHNIFPEPEPTEKEILFKELSYVKQSQVDALELVFKKAFPQINTVELFTKLKEKWYVTTKNYIEGQTKIL